jgi:hypothetical protein
MDKFLYRQGFEGLCQRDRMIRSGSMCKGIFHKQHKNQYKDRAPSPRNKPFEFLNFYFHFFSLNLPLLVKRGAIPMPIGRSERASQCAVTVRFAPSNTAFAHLGWRRHQTAV